VSEDLETAAPKAVKNMPAPLMSFEEFALAADVAPAWAGGLQQQLKGTTGLGPRPLKEWQAALNHFQVQA
jgi:hypothetical protein